jgi:hypothetical protein
MNILTSIFKNPRAWLGWLFCKPVLLWLGLAYIAEAGLYLWLFPEWGFKTYGFILQILGAIVAASAVLGNERLFELPRLRERIGGWWRSRPGVDRSLAASGVAATSMAGTLRASGWSNKSTTDTLDQQVEKLWTNFTAITQQLTQLATDADEQKRTQKADIGELRKALEGDNKKFKELLKKATVGSPLVAYFGFSLVLLGSFITTYSEWLHKLVHGA